MSDNITLNSGSGGDSCAADDIGGVKYPRSKIVIGADGTNDGDVSSANPLPVTLATGAATSAKQDTIIGHVDGLEGLLTTIDADTGGIATSAASIDTKTPALGQALAAGSVPVVLTASQLSTLTPPAAITGFATQTTLAAILAGQLPNSHDVTIDNASIAVTGTFWQATQPVSLASVPSHAVTNAGTFAVQVDGSALTSLELIDDAVYTDGSGTPSKGIAVMGTDGTNPQIVSVNASGHVNIADGGNTITVDGTVAATQSGTWTVTGAGGSFPVTDSGGSLTVDAPVGTPVFVRLSDGSSAITTLPVSLASVPSHAVTNAGTFVVQVDGTALTRLTDIETNTDSGAVVGNGTAATAQRVTLANDSTGIVALTTSTATIGKLAANSGVDIGDVDILSIAAGSNLIGDVGLQPRTSGGLSIFRSLDLDETEEDVKTSAGQVYGIVAINLKATPLYLKLYNATAANVTVGSTTPVMTIPIPSQGSTNGAGFVMNVPMGIAFSTAISAAVTTGVADADTGAPGANEAVVTILYK